MDAIYIYITHIIFINSWCNSDTVQICVYIVYIDATYPISLRIIKTWAVTLVLATQLVTNHPKVTKVDRTYMKTLNDMDICSG